MANEQEQVQVESQVEAPAPPAPTPTGPIFTKRDGTIIEVSEYVVSAADMTSVLRLKEDFEARGEYLSLKGVMLHVLGKGIDATRHYWKASDVNKNRRDFAKSAASCFNADGTIRDAEALAALAIAKGLVKGTPREV